MNHDDAHHPAVLSNDQPVSTNTKQSTDPPPESLRDNDGHHQHDDGDPRPAFARNLSYP